MERREKLWLLYIGYLCVHFNVASLRQEVNCLITEFWSLIWHGRTLVHSQIFVSKRLKTKNKTQQNKQKQCSFPSDSQVLTIPCTGAEKGQLRTNKNVPSLESPPEVGRWLLERKRVRSTIARVHNFEGSGYLLISQNISTMWSHKWEFALVLFSRRQSCFSCCVWNGHQCDNYKHQLV